MTTNRYQELIQAIQEHTIEIQNTHAKHINCEAGCHSCCLPDLHISGIEKQRIAKYIQSSSILIETLQKLKEKNPYQSTRCQMLDENGFCSIYEVRPIICRTHGLPILFQDKDQWFADVCSLNFVTDSLDILEQDDFLPLDFINHELAFANIEEDFDDSRYPIDISIFLQQ